MDRMKRVLPEGENPAVAAQGFHDAGQFAAVAYATHNTGAPFMLLKDRVIRRHMSLARAIHAAKPDIDSIDASIEAERARTEAQSDLASLRRGVKGQ
jgi:hypothetical protein